MVLTFNKSFLNRGIRYFIIKYIFLIKYQVLFGGGGAGRGLKLNNDVLKSHYRWFQYSNQGPNILFLRIKINHKFDVPMERNNLTK